MLASLLVFLALATRDVLQRQTQELLDAVGNGDKAVWNRYLDDKALLTDENGIVRTKAELVDTIGPLPAGVSGTIAVQDFRVAEHGDVAVTTYLADEHETYHGHALHCRYRVTDTWMRGGGKWRLIGSQTLAERTDPPAITLAPQTLAQYAGKYALTPDIAYEIRLRDGALEGRRGERAWEPLRAEAPDVFFVPGQPRYRKIFQRDAGGNITAMVDRREAWDLPWTRVAAHPDHALFPCRPDGLAAGGTGFGCQQLGETTLSSSPTPLYWFLGTTDKPGARPDGSLVTTVDGQTWLSSFGTVPPAGADVRQVARIGPLPLPPASGFKAVLYLAVMPGGTHTRVHTHPGPEAWYVLTGEQCLETPNGTARAAAGQAMFVEPNIPMQLVNSGTATRKALFAVIHDAAKPWTIVSEWQPKNLCAK